MVCQKNHRSRGNKSVICSPCSLCTLINLPTLLQLSYLFLKNSFEIFRNPSSAAFNSSRDCFRQPRLSSEPSQYNHTPHSPTRHELPTWKNEFCPFCPRTGKSVWQSSHQEIYGSFDFCPFVRFVPIGENVEAYIRIYRINIFFSFISYIWDKRTKPYEALFYLMKYCPHLMGQNPDKKDKSPLCIHHLC